ncbi:DUF4328 domain-containing protein [Gordonia sp. (in: high G+C Gram-positive bacteria)]|uniref:DUF4328 domain-containing protein n=1 Tax=Gordonia sp. (in: high G+C Gram-positive bacteria) TaxID=84139 RepID=UPI003C75D265
MLDVCPSCRIQAPHRPGRAACPRCGGPLQVVDQAGRALAPTAVPPHRGQPHQQQARRLAPRPNLRWIADRPAEARPSPRPARKTAALPTPSYRTVPRWGLSDSVPAAAEGPQSPTTEPKAALTRAFALTTYMLGGAAVAHLIRYIVAVVNRSTPIPMWLDLLTGAAVLVFGVCAVVGMLFALYAFVRWLLAERAQTFATANRLDPRSTRGQVLLSAIPLVNVVGAPLLLTEAAMCDGESAGAGETLKSVERIKRIALAWAVVNFLALLALAYRIGSLFSDSVQVSADGLAITTLSLAVSAVFAHWVAPRLVTIFDGSTRNSRPERRMVIA